MSIRETNSEHNELLSGTSSTVAIDEGYNSDTSSDTNSNSSISSTETTCNNVPTAPESYNELNETNNCHSFLANSVFFVKESLVFSSLQALMILSAIPACEISKHFDSFMKDSKCETMENPVLKANMAGAAIFSSLFLLISALTAYRSKGDEIKNASTNLNGLYLLSLLLSPVMGAHIYHEVNSKEANQTMAAGEPLTAALAITTTFVYKYLDHKGIVDSANNFIERVCDKFKSSNEAKAINDKTNYNKFK